MNLILKKILLISVSLCLAVPSVDARDSAKFFSSFSQQGADTGGPHIPNLKIAYGVLGATLLGVTAWTAYLVYTEKREVAAANIVRRHIMDAIQYVADAIKTNSTIDIEKFKKACDYDRTGTTTLAPLVSQMDDEFQKVLMLEMRGLVTLYEANQSQKLSAILMQLVDQKVEVCREALANLFCCDIKLSQVEALAQKIISVGR